MKQKIRVTVPRTHPAAVLACVLMAVSAVVRLVYYLPGNLTAGIVTVHLILPVSAAALFILGTIANGKHLIPCSVSAVVLGIVFFILKAFTFTPLHQALCTLLYLTVLVLYTLTVTGCIPTKKLLYPLFGLPLLYHILVEDMQLYVFAEPRVPVVDWMPEISVLCIMAALLSQAFAMRMEKTGEPAKE
ncbi:MAG: hypothetical protein IJY35_04345 [Clostridia bacterium]|nr:hypothetical protein [Clostridia bacterium]